MNDKTLTGRNHDEPQNPYEHYLAEKQDAETAYIQKSTLLGQLGQVESMAEHWRHIIDNPEEFPDVDAHEAENMRQELLSKTQSIRAQINLVDSLGYEDPEWYTRKLMDLKEQGY